MTMGPEPIIRILLMSVRFGINLQLPRFQRLSIIIAPELNSGHYTQRFY